ncbi:MAG: aminotransferase class I/II-fold pyridoxal phosphate-dependent enzyme [Pseudomonadales bacterium]
MELKSLEPQQLDDFQRIAQASYDQLKEENLSLDLTRGKPSAAQLDLSNELDGILDGFYLLQDGTDVRNYGGILGIPEARHFGAELMGIDSSETMVAGNSSLTLMYNLIAQMLPIWQEQAQAVDNKVKFICLVPGYDRHFTICEHFDIEMINVELKPSGPDMDAIESLLADDEMIKGIWCVPKYSNPTGHTYDKSTVERFARLKDVAGKNFRIMWDNAYLVHHLSDKPDSLHNIMLEAKKAGSEDSLAIFASSSKVTFAGAGIAFYGASEENLGKFEKFLSPQVIGFDKVNQLRHVRFLRDQETLAVHMDKHKDLLKPKFQLVQERLESGIGGLGIAEWTRPNGGYFVSLTTLPGIAGTVVTMAADAGVKLTPAGATFPYGVDAKDTNIRIAPTFPSVGDLEKAMDVLVACLKLASANELLIP